MGKVFAITGGIGAGKSTVAQVFGTLGVPLFNADAEAKAICNTDEDIKNRIVNLLGPSAYQNGIYNRRWVSQRIFGNEKLRLALNEIIHPAVYLRLQNFATNLKFPFGLYETAILNIQNVNNGMLAGVILVTAPFSLKMERIKKRDARTEIEIAKILESQLKDEDLLKIAQYTIQNNENHLVITQVLEVYHSIVNSLK